MIKILTKNLILWMKITLVVIIISLHLFNNNCFMTKIYNMQDI